MKRLVLLSEGHGEVDALPILTRRLLEEKDAHRSLFADAAVIRAGGISKIVKWDKGRRQPDFSEWRRRVRLAARRSNVGGILAVIDGDVPHFPAGSGSVFCARTAAKTLAAEARDSGAGKLFSIAIVFACAEYETWLVAGAESFAGKRLPDERILLPANAKIPEGDFERRGKGWLERNCISYRPTRDQAALTEIVDLNVVRSKQVRSFQRLEHAIEQLLQATSTGTAIVTPQ